MYEIIENMQIPYVFFNIIIHTLFDPGTVVDVIAW